MTEQDAVRRIQEVPANSDARDKMKITIVCEFLKDLKFHELAQIVDQG